jgi:hypothetical protein
MQDLLHKASERCNYTSPSRFMLELNNCYFVPSLSRNILSPSCLMKDGYSFASENNGCVISKDNMFVACASIVNGIIVWVTLVKSA